MQPSFADGFGVALDLLQPIDVPSTSPDVSQGTAFAASAEQPQSMRIAESSTLFPMRGSLPETPTLGGRSATSPPGVFCMSKSPSCDTPARQQRGPSESVESRQSPEEQTTLGRQPGPVGESARDSGKSQNGRRPAQASVTGNSDQVRASAAQPDSHRPSAASSLDSPRATGTGQDLSDLSMANVDGRPSDAEMYIAPEHVSMVSMHTNPIHRRRPPMLRLPSENGSAAGRSVMQSSHALLPEPTTIPAVTNDINVVDADQHIQNDQARSELFVYPSTCPHILCLADVWGMQEK